MRTPTHLAVALVAGLALAGCGAGERATASSEEREQQAEDAMLAYTKCMREQGVDIRDPEPGERGLKMVAPPQGVSPEEMREAEEACRKHLEAIEPPELSDEQRQELEEAALAHARCMREHGIDMPDPTFGDDGRIQQMVDRASGVDPEDPDFREAEEACRDELPEIGELREGSP